MTKKTTCRVRIPPVADKATTARTEAKALMRGLLEEMGVPALTAKVEAQEAELRRMREANNYLAQRLQASVGDTFTVVDMAEALLESLSVMSQNGVVEPNTADETAPLPDITTRGEMLTDEQSQEAIRRLIDGPSMLDRLLGATPENPQATSRIRFGPTGFESDVVIAGSENTAAHLTRPVQSAPSPFVSNPPEGDDEEEDPIGDLEM